MADKKKDDEKDPFADVELPNDNPPADPGPNAEGQVTESDQKLDVTGDPTRVGPSAADVNKENFSGKDGSDVSAKRFNPKGNVKDEDHANGITQVKGR